MTDFEKEEFWKSLARLYDETDRLKEAIDRMKERHEALTQTVELTVAENRQRDRRLGEIMEGIASLLHVAEIHEQRIERLEGGE